MSKFAECKQGDVLKSKRFGDMTFLAYEPKMGKCPIIALSAEAGIYTFGIDGSFWDCESPDLTIPPKMKEVKRYVGIVASQKVMEGFWTTALYKSREMLLDTVPSVQDIQEITFNVKEEGKK